MDSIAYLGESAALGLLARALALTAFYTAILWLPLRGMAALLRHLELRKASRRKRARARKPAPMRSVTLIR